MCVIHRFSGSRCGHRTRRRATARHEGGGGGLTFGELAGFAADFLTADGRLTVLLPPPEMVQFAGEAEAYALFLQTELHVRHRRGGRVTRHISAFGRGVPAQVRHTELNIRDDDDTGYSKEFRALLAGFYLDF